jgi:hypothetical protein
VAVTVDAIKRMLPDGSVCVVLSRAGRAGCVLEYSAVVAVVTPVVFELGELKKLAASVGVTLPLRDIQADACLIPSGGEAETLGVLERIATNGFVVLGQLSDVGKEFARESDAVYE